MYSSPETGGCLIPVVHEALFGKPPEVRAHGGVDEVNTTKYHPVFKDQVLDSSNTERLGRELSG